MVITRADIVERVVEWQLTEEVIEKDYVLGWPLWGFGSDPVLGNRWVFKGGTCLKKCYIETHRFSEDLDFTVLPSGPYRPEQIEPLPGRVLARVHDASGIDFSSRAPALRPRDLYDIINLFRRNDLRLYPELIGQALEEKCAAKSIAVPTAADFVDSPLIAALEGDWSQMLAHQLPALPPLQDFLDELPLLFGWLDGTVEFEDLPALPHGADEEAWSPPPTVATWGAGIPLETVRFAATNHLCVELHYDGSWRLIEPYSLRRSSAGRLLLHAERSDGSGHRAYGVDKIAGLRVTTTPFRPRYPSSSPPKDLCTPRPRVGP